MKISVLGTGAWGTALAIHAVRAGHEVCLWGRDAAAINQMWSSRRNADHLPDSDLPTSLLLTADHDRAVAHACHGLTFIATPIAGLRERLLALPATQRTLWLCKGFEAGTERLGHEIARAVQPRMRGGVLSGPTLAHEVAAGRPTALVAASLSEDLIETVIDALHDERLRVYPSSDPMGVEISGAVKSVLAMAAGACDGLSITAPEAPGLNARAALITRGLTEMQRLGATMGARAETFMGLSALGDLVLTATGGSSRARQVGLMLAQGHTRSEIAAKLVDAVDELSIPSMVMARARRAGVDMPICAAVAAMLDRQLGADEAIRQLTGRPSAKEDGTRASR